MRQNLSQYLQSTNTTLEAQLNEVKRARGEDAKTQEQAKIDRAQQSGDASGGQGVQEGYYGNSESYAKQVKQISANFTAISQALKRKRELLSGAGLNKEQIEEVFKALDWDAMHPVFCQLHKAYESNFQILGTVIQSPRYSELVNSMEAISKAQNLDEQKCKTLFEAMCGKPMEIEGEEAAYKGLEQIILNGVGDQMSGPILEAMLTNAQSTAQQKPSVEFANIADEIEGDAKITVRCNNNASAAPEEVTLYRLNGKFYRAGNSQLVEKFEDLSSQNSFEVVKTEGVRKWNGVTDKKDRDLLRGILTNLPNDSNPNDDQKAGLLMTYSVFFAGTSNPSTKTLTDFVKILLNEGELNAELKVKFDINYDRLGKGLTSLSGDVGVYHEFFQGAPVQSIFPNCGEIRGSSVDDLDSDRAQRILKSEEYLYCNGTGSAHGFGLVFDDQRGDAGGALNVYVQDSTQSLQLDHLQCYLDRILQVVPDVQAKDLNIVKTCALEGELFPSSLGSSLQSQCRFSAALFSERVLAAVKSRRANPSVATTETDILSLGGLKYSQADFTKKFAERFDEKFTDFVKKPALTPALDDVYNGAVGGRGVDNGQEFDLEVFDPEKAVQPIETGVTDLNVGLTDAESAKFLALAETVADVEEFKRVVSGCKSSLDDTSKGLTAQIALERAFFLEAAREIEGSDSQKYNQGQAYESSSEDYKRLRDSNRNIRSELLLDQDIVGDDPLEQLRNKIQSNAKKYKAWGFFFDENEKLRTSLFKRNESKSKDELSDPLYTDFLAIEKSLEAKKEEIEAPRKDLLKRLIKYQLQEIGKEGSATEKPKKIAVLRNLVVLYTGQKDDKLKLDEMDDVTDFAAKILDALLTDFPFKIGDSKKLVETEEVILETNSGAKTSELQLTDDAEGFVSIEDSGIKDLLKKYQERRELVGGLRGQKATVQNKISISLEAKEICFSLKRRFYDERGQQDIKKLITFSDISLSNETVFQPTAISVYRDRIHYVTYIKENDGGWYCYNNEERGNRIEDINSVKEVKKDAYFVKYSKKDEILPEATVGTCNVTGSMCWANSASMFLGSSTSLLSESVVLSEGEKKILKDDFARIEASFTNRRVPSETKSLGDEIDGLLKLIGTGQLLPAPPPPPAAAATKNPSEELNLKTEVALEALKDIRKEGHEVNVTKRALYKVHQKGREWDKKNDQSKIGNKHSDIWKSLTKPDQKALINKYKDTVDSTERTALDEWLKDVTEKRKPSELSEEIISKIINFSEGKYAEEEIFKWSMEQEKLNRDAHGIYGLDGAVKMAARGESPSPSSVKSPSAQTLKEQILEKMPQIS